MSQYIDRKEAQKSYRPVAGSMSPGLKRAREPYRVKNAILGLSLGAFAVGVWAYSISAVKQDIFDDVDEEAKALSSPPAPAAAAGSSQSAIAAAVSPADQKKQAIIAPTTAVPTLSPATSSDPVILTEVEKARPAPAARGVLQHLNGRLPRLLDPQGKTLVWGAPPVDNVGKISKS